MKRKLLSVLCLLLCAVLLLPVTGCEKKTTLPEPIAFPVEGFTWGMTLEEAKTVLNEKGVEPMISQSSEDKVLISIAPEDLKKLGVEQIAGLELRMDGYMAFAMQFNRHSSGVYRLVWGNALVWATAEKTELTEDETKERLCTALDESYGKPPENKRTHWSTYGATLTEEDCAKLSPDTLARVQRYDYAADSIYPSVWFMPDVGGRAILYFHAMEYVELLYGL